MKILLICKQLNFILQSFTSPLNRIAEIGLSTEFNEEGTNQFNPDLIISDNVYTSNHKYYNIKNIYNLEAFINLDSLVILPKEPKYCYDVVYMGPITGFEKQLTHIYKKGFKVCHFNSKASDTIFYNGNLDMGKSYTVYHNSKACPVFDGSQYRLMDIIASDGNPVPFVDEDQFLKDCLSAIDGKKVCRFKSKDEIINKHTNYDRASEVLKSLEFDDAARKVISLK